MFISIFWKSKHNNPSLKDHCSLDIEKVILESILFNSGHVEINFKIYLTEISHSVLKLCGIFSRGPVREIFKQA